MDPVKKTYVDPDDILGQEMNEIQDAMVELRWADSCTNNVPPGWVKQTTLPTQRIGEVKIGIHHQIGAAGHTDLDTSRDWRDRYVEGWVAGENAAQGMPGGNAFVGSTNVPTFEGVRFWGYTGKGSTLAAPPVPLVGAGIGEQWDLRTWSAASFGGASWGVVGTSVIYVDQADGKLKFYSGGGAAIYIWGVIGFSGDIGGF